MVLIKGALKHYDWGSRSAIPDLLGHPSTGEPVAEVWFGAHPSGPATLCDSGVRLDQLIGVDPQAALGSSVAARFGSLPFMMKVLAAQRPLSLQTHPSAEQARSGFEREESLGIDRHSADRCFRDQHHKPELICALSEFSALCGFREPAETLDLLASIPTRDLDPLRAKLAVEPTPSGISGVLEWLLGQARQATADLVRSVVAGCVERNSAPFALERQTVYELGRRYPHDPAVLIALLLNLVTLQPGEAIFFGPGNLHCYLRGLGVEVMASSDNVVRAGLTSKRVDRATLLEIVETAPLTVDVQRPAATGGVVSYRSPVEEFSLQRIELNGSASIGEGPAILLCVAGQARFASGTQSHRLGRGSALWQAAGRGPALLEGAATVFRAGVGPGSHAGV